MMESSFPSFAAKSFPGSSCKYISKESVLSPRLNPAIALSLLSLFVPYQCRVPPSKNFFVVSVILKEATSLNLSPPGVPEEKAFPYKYALSLQYALIPMQVKLPVPLKEDSVYKEETKEEVTISGTSSSFVASPPKHTQIPVMEI